MQLALGPLLYYWPRDQVLNFYADVVGWPVDTVYLGETVCSRRRELRFADWMDIGLALADAGKEVVFSTMELLESDADLRAMHAVVDNGQFRVEANDMAAASRLAGRPFVAGPFLNVYNAGTLAVLAEMGATRWVAPVELSREGIAAIVAESDPALETEVFAWGRLPLAVSARCFTARYYNLRKDQCEFRCIEHPDGLALDTQDQRHFLTLNGVQTQSAGVQNLAPMLDEARAAGIRMLRLSPQARGTADVVHLFRAIVDGAEPLASACTHLAALAVGEHVDGYWYGRPGLQRIHEDLS
ncbi:MAG: U32 family peptidase [Gammaproteobacteria bacterium]|nr:U32 family peptidase [Gammaproteobacteria bacterium]